MRWANWEHFHMKSSILCFLFHHLTNFNGKNVYYKNRAINHEQEHFNAFEMIKISATDRQGKDWDIWKVTFCWNSVVIRKGCNRLCWLSHRIFDILCTWKNITHSFWYLLFLVSKFYFDLKFFNLICISAVF